LIASATEEILRWATPVMYLRRNVTRDTELRGQALKPATRSASGTSRRIEMKTCSRSPFRFDIERQPNEHVAFGAGGPHFCLAQASLDWSFECCSKN